MMFHYEKYVIVVWKYVGPGGERGSFFHTVYIFWATQAKNLNTNTWKIILNEMQIV